MQEEVKVPIDDFGHDSIRRKAKTKASLNKLLLNPLRLIPGLGFVSFENTKKGMS
jgi:hypothetical protein